MYYFVFDLDKTVADLNNIYNFIIIFKIKNFVPKEYYDNNREFFDKIDHTYYHFVKKIVEIEKSYNPLGILRPGIIDIMRQLEDLRQDNQVRKVIIYSNNYNIERLEFVRDIIINAIVQFRFSGFNKVRSNEILIQDLIHWGHPDRKEEIIYYYGNPTSDRNKPKQFYTKPGHAKKTWAVLKNIATHHFRDNSDFVPHNVFFFDNNTHEHLIKKELGNNYYRVLSYNSKIPINRLSAILRFVFRMLLRDGQFNMTLYINLLEEYVLGYIKYNPQLSDLDNLINHVEKLSAYKEPVVNTTVSAQDDGINMMLNAITKVKLNKKYKNNRNNNKLQVCPEKCCTIM